MALEFIGHSEATFASVEPILAAAASGTSSTPDELSLLAAENDKALHSWVKTTAIYELL